jgi:hypothetical protein
MKYRYGEKTCTNCLWILLLLDASYVDEIA